MADYTELLARLDNVASIFVPHSRLTSEAASAIRDLTAQLEQERKAREEAEVSYKECQSVLKDERYCHGQETTRLKRASSEIIQLANDRAESAERRVAELEKREIGLTRKILRLQDRLAEVERETYTQSELSACIERCAKVALRYVLKGATTDQRQAGWNMACADIVESIRALAPEQNTAATQDQANGEARSVGLASAASPTLEHILAQLGNHGPEFRLTALRVIGPLVEDAERYRWLRKQNGLGPQVVVTLNQYGDGYTPLPDEGVDAAIDAARAKKGEKNA